jgi:hypothetical protein
MLPCERLRGRLVGSKGNLRSWCTWMALSALCWDEGKTKSRVHYCSNNGAQVTVRDTQCLRVQCGDTACHTRRDQEDNETATPPSFAIECCTVLLAQHLFIALQRTPPPYVVNHINPILLYAPANQVNERSPNSRPWRFYPLEEGTFPARARASPLLPHSDILKAHSPRLGRDG